MRNWIDIFIAMGIAGVGAGLAMLMPEGDPARLLLTIPFVIAAPGYVVVAALLPENDLGFVEKIATSLGTTFAITVLLGFVLHYTGLAINAESWAFVLANVTFAFGLIAVVRRQSLSEWEEIRRPMDFGFTWGNGFMFSLATVILIAAVILASRGQSAQNNENFTQLWLLPGESQTVTVGVRNFEYQDATYRLEITAGGQMIEVFDDLTLDDREEWQRRLPLADANQPVSADLYIEGEDEAYRSVTLNPGGMD